LETAFKSISCGLVLDNGSYLRESWNQLDFFIVITSIIDAVFKNVNLPIIKVPDYFKSLDPETAAYPKAPKVHFPQF